MNENRSGIREVPAKVVGSDGRTADAVIATPAWTRAELEEMVRGDVERGWLTEEEADRMIEQGRDASCALTVPRGSAPKRGRSR